MKICPKCNFYESDNTSDYCQKCGTFFPNASNKALTEQYEKNESYNLYRKNLMSRRNDEKLKRLVVADIILIILFIPLSILGANKLGLVIMILFLAIFLMLSITIKMIITKYSVSDSKKIPENDNIEGSTDKVIKSGFILNAMKFGPK